MTIKELEKLSKGLRDGSMKRKVVIEWRLGLLKYKEIVVTLKINRREFRRWIRWEYFHRVFKYKNVIDMSKETDIRKLITLYSYAVGLSLQAITTSFISNVKTANQSV